MLSTQLLFQTSSNYKPEIILQSCNVCIAFSYIQIILCFFLIFEIKYKFLQIKEHNYQAAQLDQKRVLSFLQGKHVFHMHCYTLNG